MIGSIPRTIGSCTVTGCTFWEWLGGFGRRSGEGVTALGVRDIAERKVVWYGATSQLPGNMKVMPLPKTAAVI